MKFLKPAVFAALLACAACSPQATETKSPAASAAEQNVAKEEANKATVTAFYEAAINEKNYEKALTYIGDEYVQHNPTAPDGKEGLKGFVDFLNASFPESRSEIKHVYADGDFVILHVHSVREPGTLGRAIVDIFRLDDAGKVVEHWDVVQDIPAEPLNDNTMF